MTKRKSKISISLNDRLLAIISILQGKMFKMTFSYSRNDRDCVTIYITKVDLFLLIVKLYQLIAKFPDTNIS